VARAERNKKKLREPFPLSPFIQDLSSSLFSSSFQLSESDFTDPTRRDGGGSLVPWGLAKQYDLIYSDQGGDWNDFARNWTLAVDCFVELVAKRNASIHIMGRDPAKEPKLKALAEAGFITHHPPKTPWRDCLKVKGNEERWGDGWRAR
jgi:hypothetical protein